MAEVLITLGIIGIVAAITLPTLIHKIEQKILISQFKKMYANLNTALQQTVFQDNDGNPYPCWHINGANEEHDCTQFYKDFTKHLKLIKTEKIEHLPYKNENEVKAENGTLIGIHEYPQSDTTIYTTFSNGTSGYYKYYFADGSTFYSPTGYYTLHPINIILDVNGDKKPNRWGYDVYVLKAIKRNDGIMYISSSNEYLVEKGGMSAEEIIKK